MAYPAPATLTTMRDPNSTPISSIKVTGTIPNLKTPEYVRGIECTHQMDPAITHTDILLSANQRDLLIRDGPTCTVALLVYFFVCCELVFSCFDCAEVAENITSPKSSSHDFSQDILLHTHRVSSYLETKALPCRVIKIDKCESVNIKSHPRSIYRDK